MPDDKKMIEPINAGFDEVAKSMVTPAPHLPKENNYMHSNTALTPATLSRKTP